MANQKAFFLTGANAKIKVNLRTIAFCTNISYSVTINHDAPILLGMYEGSSVEPLSYVVNGSFSVIRYTAGIPNDSGKLNTIETPDTGNGIGAWGPSGLVERVKAGLKIDPSKADGRAYDNLNPAKLSKGTTFDIEIHQKYNTGDDAHSIAKIRGCRITGTKFDLSNKTLATQSFNFRALYVDEDSFLSDFSGFGQHLR